MFFIISMASVGPGGGDSNSTTIPPAGSPSNTSSLVFGPQKTILGLSVDTFSYIFLSIGGAAPVIFILVVIVGMKCYSNSRIERMKRDRQMYQTSMELWEAERRYQASATSKARGAYEGPGLTSLAEEEALDGLSRSLTLNGTLPNQSAHSLGLRISTNNPNVFFRETSLIEEDTLGNNSRKGKPISNGNNIQSNKSKRPARNNKSSNRDTMEFTANNAHKRPASTSNRITTAAAIEHNSVVSMETQRDGRNFPKTGHIVLIPLKSQTLSDMAAATENAGKRDRHLHRQLSYSGTLSHSINSEERQALEVFDQIYEDHISETESTASQVTTANNLDQKNNEPTTSDKNSPLSAGHRKHQYENTTYSVLGPGFQEDSTSFNHPDNDGPFEDKDGNFYFRGESHSSGSDITPTKPLISQTNRTAHMGGPSGQKFTSPNDKPNNLPNHLSHNGGMSINRPQVHSDRSAGHYVTNVDNLVTTITEKDEQNGSVTSYTIANNVSKDHQHYRSTVLISQTPDEPAVYPDTLVNKTTRSNSYSNITSSADNEENWNTLYSNRSQMSNISNIDDYIDDSTSSTTEHGDTSNCQINGIPNYCQVNKVEMKVHRVPNSEDLNRTQSWLHEAYVNTAYITE